MTGYPKKIKAFYMKQNDDGKTVRAMDVLFPRIGEIVGGSQREENLQVLEARIAELGIPAGELWWYLDTRRLAAPLIQDSAWDSRDLILFITGMSNIRDVIPFPRTPNNADF
jgi:asparaginyl-tRNA synthetase